MKAFRTASLLSFLIAACAVPAAAAPEDTEGPALTVYSSADPASFDPQQFIAQQRQGYGPTSAAQVPGFGVVKEIRKVDLKAGISEIRFTDIAEFIDPTTVSFTDLTNPDGTSVLEQNFQFDLANSDKILDRYLDREIGVVVSKGDSTETVTGKLLSSAGNQIVLSTPSGVQIVSKLNPQLKLGELPGGLISRPTLVWKLHSKESGNHKVRTTYQTSGVTWRSDYNLVVNETDTKADLSAWVTLLNLSGSSYKNAQLKLIAGDVQRVQPRQQNEYRMLKSAGIAADMAAPAGFQEKSFFEYHLYTLPRRTDVAMNSSQQLTLFPTAHDVGVEKVLVYYGLPESASWSFFGSPLTDRNLGGQSNTKVDVYLTFKNEEKNHMGMPLPAGKVRVYKQDGADGTLEFIGEDLIDHTAKDEKVLVKLGQSFDVVGERTQTNFTLDTSGKTATESFKITLRNHKKTEQKIVVRENLYRWSQWKLESHSDDFEKIDARTIHFPVTVPADGSKTVTYTVKYSW